MPSTLRWRPGSVLARCRCWASERSKMSFTSVDLPEPDTPVTAIRQPERERDVDVRAGCARAAPRTVTTSPVPGRRRAGTGMDRLPDRYCPVMEALLDSSPPRPVTGPACTTLPPCSPAPGPDVDHVVGGADGLLVVLDHDDRVAEVAQALQGADQALVVALVQADRGLVEHVEHADQAAADLAGQPDALGLAARERAGRAGQRQVVEADVEQELHALAHFLEAPGRRSCARGRSARASPWRRPRRRSTGCTARRCSARPPSRPATRASAGPRGRRGSRPRACTARSARATSPTRTRRGVAAATG